MKKILFIIIFLLQSFPSFSEKLYNKGFLCERVEFKEIELSDYKYYSDDIIGLDFFEKDKMKVWLWYKSFNTDELVERKDFSESSYYQLDEKQLTVTLKSKLLTKSKKLVINRFDLSMLKQNKIFEKRWEKFKCKLYTNQSFFQRETLNSVKNLLKQRKF